MDKPWYKSNTKLGAVVGGAGTVLVAFGSAISGEISVPVAIEMGLVGLGAILFGVGIRNAINDI